MSEGYYYIITIMSSLRKTLFTLNVGNYAPEITELTYPFLKRYAEKIGANFVIIDKRQFPEWPLLYEKLQIYELGKDNDWNIYVDSDCLIHPDLFDITEMIPENTVLNYGVDFANIRFKYDDYFRRDGRHIGSGNFLTVASHLCREVWEPLTDMTKEEAMKNIKIAHFEELTGHEQGYNIDDYVISRNIAKYGLKFKTFLALLNEIGRPNDEYFAHNHSIPEKEKVNFLKQTLSNWKF